MVLSEGRNGSSGIINLKKLWQSLIPPTLFNQYDMNKALENTERIQAVFLDTQLFYATHDSMPALIEYLDNTDPEFSSIAYESASMLIAINDIEACTFPTGWLTFADGPALPHKAQVYVGLGWAIAKLNLPFLETLNKLETHIYFRIADGCGYYDGSFRRRQTVLSQQLPFNIPVEALPMYDQGVGRSIWYTAKTDIAKIRSMIETFPANRQPDLWRGIGIAVAYVGGCSETELKTLWQYAGISGLQLAIGAALAARSRIQANTITADTDRCSRLWFTLVASDTKLIAFKPGEHANEKTEMTYLSWIDQIEAYLLKKF